jgi:hypothetical protein
LPIELGVIHNMPGRYWGHISYFILGLHDVRPRIGTFTNPWGAVSNPIFAQPKVRFVGDSLSDLMDRRACELLDISARENRTIAVMWSGGIDSTGVLTALIKNCTNLDQLEVFCSQKSILENPVFFKNHISNKIKCSHVRELDVSEQFIDNNILVHGDPGDCLFGPSMPMYEQLVTTGAHRESWKNHRKDLIHGIASVKTIIPGFADWYVNKVSDNIEECEAFSPYKIDSVSDWWWWHYFNLKWEFSLLRPFFETRKDLRTTISQAHLKRYADTVFFNSDDFQNWSYSNLDNLCIDKAHHKAPIKKYICEFDKNEFYMKNKPKTVSLAGVIANRPMVLNKDLYSYFSSDDGLSETMRQLLEDYKG